MTVNRKCIGRFILLVSFLLVPFLLDASFLELSDFDSAFEESEEPFDSDFSEVCEELAVEFELEL